MPVTDFTDTIVPLFLNFNSVEYGRLLIQRANTRVHGD